MTIPGEIELAEPKTETEWEQYNAIRYEILRKPHGLQRGSESDHPLEEISTHIVAKVDGRIVGAGCWAMLTRPDGKGGRYKYMRYRQIAVDPQYRNHGIATKITDLMEAMARARGAQEITGSPRDDVVAYFRRKGYHATGEGLTAFNGVKHTNICKPLR